MIKNKQSVDFLLERQKEIDNLIESLNNDSVLILNKPTKLQKSFLNDLTNTNKLIKITNNIYIDSEWTMNDFLIRQLVLKQGIYSGMTALYLWDLTDEFQYDVTMTFKLGYRLPKSYGEFTNNVTAHQLKSDLLNSNISELDVLGSHYKIKLFSRERTLIDILKEPIGEDVIDTAYRRYLKSDDADKNELLEIAYDLGQIKKIKARLGKYL